MSSWLQLGGAVVSVGVGVGEGAVGAVGALQMPVRSTLYALCAGPGSTHMNAMLQADDAGVQCSGRLLLRRALHSPQAEEWLCTAAALGWGWLGLGAKVPGLGVCVSEGCCGSCLLPTGP